MLFDNSNTIKIPNTTQSYNISTIQSSSFNYTSPNTFTLPSNSLNNTYVTSTVDTGCVVYTKDGEHTYLGVNDIQEAYTDAEWVRDLKEKAEKYPAVAKLYEQLLLTLRLTHNAEQGEENNDKI
jgi:hypothetical protein